jgi:hypothetical protein
MKKIGLIVFIAALTIGSIFSANCSFNSFSKNLGVTHGSGMSKVETRNVSGFDEIEASGAVNVEVSVQKDFSVTVEADDNLLQYIKTETSGNTLKIYTEGSISTKTKIYVKISMPEINSVDVSGASTIAVSNVKSDSIKLEASGASKIKIDGEANTMEADASGASGINAEGLKVETADIEASGASNATVWANDELKADASGASSIYYAGEPKNLTQNSSGASSVKKK